MIDSSAPSQGVNSIQRMSSPSSPSGPEVAAIYWAWLNKAWGPLVDILFAEQRISILVLGIPAIVLRVAGPGTYELEGGLLAQPGGVFAFRARDTEVETALEGFRPTLPLWLYHPTHGLLHEWTMRRFRRHLTSLEARRP